MLFPMNILNKAYLILILNIDDKAAADHDTVVESGTPTNIISPIILAALVFLLSLLFSYQSLLLLA